MYAPKTPWKTVDRFATTAYCVVMRFKHMSRFQGVRGRQRGSLENRGRATVPARYTGGPRRSARSTQLSQDRRGACRPPQDTQERPRHRATASGAHCPVSGKSAAVTSAIYDGFRGRRRCCVGRKGKKGGYRPISKSRDFCFGSASFSCSRSRETFAWRSPPRSIPRSGLPES